jgi:hypothetical protein
MRPAGFILRLKAGLEKKNFLPMKRPPVPQQLSFQSRLERIASGAEYFALSVPVKISRALQTRGPVPVSARVNDSMPFLVSLFPVGGGRHYLRVKAKVRSAAKIKGGDRVQVHITVLDRSAVSIPQDLTSALRAEGVIGHFKALPLGKQRYTVRWIGEAAKPQTREKRIQTAVEIARRKKTISGT